MIEPISIHSQTLPELSVVIPCFNEADNIDGLLARLDHILPQCSAACELVFVDDGSKDETLTKLRTAIATNACAAASLHVIALSRNFGKEIAIAAGLDFARGQAVVIMDADLQHPPETILTFMQHWRAGYQNIYGVRKDRVTDSPLRKNLTHRFYQLFANFGEIALPEGAGDFRLLDRVCVEALRAMGERARFSKGLYAWIGFRSIGVPFDVAERASGQSKFSYGKLTKFALDGLMSFSTIPLKIWSLIGVAISTFSLGLGLFFLLRTILFGVDVPGYASLIVSVLMLAGMQLLSLGVIGEYIGRIFAEVKRRPLYLVAEHVSNVPDLQPLSPLPKRWPNYLPKSSDEDDTA